MNLKSQLRSVNYAAVAGTAATIIIPPGNRRWHVLQMAITLITDATVANRYIRVRQLDGPDAMGQAFRSDVRAASGTHVMSIGPYELDAITTLDDDCTVILHRPIELSRSASIVVDIVGGVAGDAFTTRVQVEDMVSGN